MNQTLYCQSRLLAQTGFVEISYTEQVTEELIQQRKTTQKKMMVKLRPRHKRNTPRKEGTVAYWGFSNVLDAKKKKNIKLYRSADRQQFQSSSISEVKENFLFMLTLTYEFVKRLLIFVFKAAWFLIWGAYKIIIEKFLGSIAKFLLRCVIELYFLKVRLCPSKKFRKNPISRRLTNRKYLDLSRLNFKTGHYSGEKEMTLVIDLDNTLVYSCTNEEILKDKNSLYHTLDVNHHSGSLVNSQIQFEGGVERYFVMVRPHAQDFLAEMHKYFNLVIFTAGVQEYADPVIDFIDPEGLIQRRYYRDVSKRRRRC